jgi:tetratricopeptide (TPR) repeat protein
MNIRARDIFSLLLLLFVLLTGCAEKQVKSPYKDYFDSEAGLAKSRSGPDESGRTVGEKLRQIDWQEDQARSQSVTSESAVAVEKILVLPTVPDVDQRMTVYADKMSSWETITSRLTELDLSDRRPERWDECLASIADLFRDYSTLMEILLRQDHPAVDAERFGVDPWVIYRDDINFLEGGCDQVFIAGADLLNSIENRDTKNREKQSEAFVSQYAINGRYEEAIMAFQSLVSEHPDRSVSSSTRRMYGMALLRTGQLAQAGDVLSEALESMSPSAEERSLRRLVADLLLASGRLNDARIHYRKLANYFESRKGDDRWVTDQLALLGDVNLRARELPLYYEALKLYIGFDDRHIPEGMQELVGRMEEDFPHSSLTYRTRQMLRQIEDSINEWVTGKLDQVDTLLANDDYAQAKSLLEQMLVDDLPLPMHDTVQRAMDKLVLGEVNYQTAQQQIMEQTLSDQWDNAVRLLDAKKYDKAIGALSTLFNTEYDAPARAKAQEAADAVSEEMRQKSSSFFLKARRERDFERKRELFRESWQLLYDITVKYPDAKRINKVRQHLGTIEDHIELFDPGLLKELKMVPGFRDS